jgi:protein phosphatase
MASRPNYYTSIVVLNIPARALVLLVGASGCGKTTFARKHFKSTEIVSSDALRAAVSDDEADQSASADAFEVLRLLTGKRLRRGRLTVIDATSVQRDARRSLLALAARHGRPTIAIVLHLPLEACLARIESRTDRAVAPEVVQKQTSDLDASLPGLGNEGFEQVYLLENAEDIDSAQVFRTDSAC